ncbi:hypothetical protein HGA89_08190, partial [bacterium]|nr:hypothetical protein [bacterium]
MRKLTATMIVRNEERRLPACLDSLAGVADTLAVVDTGSRDGTLAARRPGPSSVTVAVSYLPHAALLAAICALGGAAAATWTVGACTVAATATGCGVDATWTVTGEVET